MPLAETLKNYLEERSINYDLVEHKPSMTSRTSARAARLPAHQIAKAVVLVDDDGFVLGVVPANQSLELDWVNEELGRELRLATEDEFTWQFVDCEHGAVPALGEAYDLQVIWDNDLQYTADVYIEAGDHKSLIWIDRKDFKRLMSELPHTVISKDPEVGCWKY